MSSLDNSSGSTYVQYKTVTQRFKDALQSMVPATMFLTDSVNDLSTAAEYVAEKNVPVKMQLLDDLKHAIRYRTRIAKQKYGGGDEGHSHFIAVLNYCWTLLAPQKQVVEPRVGVPKVATADRVRSNRFSFLMGAEDTDDDYTEVDLPSGPMPRPEDKGPIRLSLQELIEGTDRMDTIAFLITLDELMRFVSIQFTKLKEASSSNQAKEGYPPNAIVEHMMETSVATNFAIQQVAALEQLFIHDHPHLSTVYRALANLIMVEPIRDLTEVVSKNSPIAAEFSEKHAAEFVGDVMECAFRNPSDPKNKRDSLVADFLDRWKFSDVSSLPNAALQTAYQKLKDSVANQQILDIDSLSIQPFPNVMVSVQRVFKYVEIKSKLEVPLRSEMTCEVRTEAEMFGMKHHAWLDNHAYIGNNRSITHTIRLVQALSNVIGPQRGRLISAKNGMFGPSWTAGSPPFSKMQIEMDALLMEDILPPLINMCYGGMLAKDLPFHNELLTMFAQIKSMVKYPESTVSWSLAFTVHSILTAVFESQGSNHLSYLAETARDAFWKYDHDIDWTAERTLVPISRRPPIWDHNTRTLRSLQYLVHPPTLETSKEQRMLSSWNPLCAGTFLSYIAYFGNLEAGMTLVDSVAQLRVTLHLYNALLQAKVISKGQVELLDWIFDTFKESKAIWEGELPNRGQYVTRWWIAYGMKAKLAAEMQNKPLAQKHGRMCDETRVMTPIELKQLSTSFRRICLHDFSDVVDKYHSESMIPQEGNQLITVYEHAVRVNDTLDAMEEDGRLLATNFVSLGFYLNQFYLSLFTDFGWMDLVDKIVREAPIEIKKGRRTDFRRVGPNSWEGSDENMKYQAMSRLFAEFALRPLDDGDALVASRCAEFMVVHFNAIPPERIMWFTPVVYSDDSSESTSST